MSQKVADIDFNKLFSANFGYTAASPDACAGIDSGSRLQRLCQR